MSQQRRKTWAGKAAKVILVLVIVDILAYAAVDRPLANLVAREQDRFTSVRLEWWRERGNLARLQKRVAALPAEQRQTQTFLDHHIPPRREAFSRAATLIEGLTQQSQVELSAIKYTPGEAHGEPVGRLNLDTNVKGSFENLLGFAHALETANDFIVVRSFKFAAGDGGVLALHVDADLYLTP
ncbi:MAG: hypothetical protein ACRD2G_10855, partial [Terriglobia bacterium]